MVQVKSNLAPTGSAILFEVAEKGVDFISEMEMTAEEAFQSLAPKMGRPNEKEIKAKEFLLEMLKDYDIIEIARTGQISLSRGEMAVKDM